MDWWIFSFLLYSLPKSLKIVCCTFFYFVTLYGYYDCLRKTFYRAFSAGSLQFNLDICYQNYQMTHSQFSPRFFSFAFPPHYWWNYIQCELWLEFSSKKLVFCWGEDCCIYNYVVVFHFMTLKSCRFSCNLDEMKFVLWSVYGLMMSSNVFIYIRYLSVVIIVPIICN